MRVGLVASFVAQALVVFGVVPSKLVGLDNVEVSKKYATLATPAGFAFAIWGVIYTWEVVAVAYVALAAATPLSQALSDGVRWVVVANVAQALWAVSFSAEYLAASTLCLAAITGSLCCAAEAMHSTDLKDHLVVATPTSLRAGWCTAATLVNVNLVLVQRRCAPKLQLATAYGTAYAALVAGAAAALSRGDAAFTIPLAWALFAIGKELSPGEKKKAALPTLDGTARAALKRTNDALAAVLALLALAAVFVVQRK